MLALERHSPHGQGPPILSGTDLSDPVRFKWIKTAVASPTVRMQVLKQSSLKHHIH